MLFTWCPLEQIRTDDAASYVLQVVGHELKRKNVETALSNLTQVEIAHGLAQHDLIAINSVNGKPIGDKTQVKF